MPIQGLILMVLLFAFSARAQKSFEIVVEDFRIREGFAESTPAVSVIESAEIEKSGAESVSELLTGVPGIFVAQNGGSSQPTSVFIRGAESRHTLVLLDGMELNDPLNPSRGFDFSSLTTENIERIEIFRGAQSVKFGSDAIGGVINIITKQGSGRLKGHVMLEGGSYSTLNNSAEISGSKDKYNYSFGTSFGSSAGFSSAAGGNEADSFQRVTLSGRAGSNISSDTNVNVSLRATELKADLDAFGGPTGDDPNYTSESHQYVGGVFVKTRSFERRLATSFGGTVSLNNRSDDNPADSLQPNQSADNFTSLASKIETRNEFAISDLHSIQFGVQLKNESGHSESTFNAVPANLPENSIYTNGVYGFYKYQQETFFTELGLRQDMRTGGNGISSYSAGMGFLVEPLQTEVRASVATGFKTPSLYQLYSSLGNPDLNDEKSSSAEFSAEKKFTPEFSVSFTYFVNKYYDLIEFDTVTSTYFNIAESSSRGTEIQGTWQADRNFLVRGSFTNLLAVNDSNGFKLLRRPDITYSFDGTYIYGAWDSTLAYSYTGERSDIDPVTLLRIGMPSYDVVKLRVAYNMNKLTKLSLRVANLLNRQYQSVAGFGSSEQAFYAGVTREF